MSNLIQCQRCTACCRWPGHVVLSDAEIAKLAAFLGSTEHEFIQKFTRLRHDRRGLSLIEKPNGDCIFLEGNSCAVQAVKPLQCLDFPNGWMDRLWGKVPLETIQKNYPMLANCAGYKKFLKNKVV
ncbi:MAG TPA: YkgJ family cysteine cluster protein [Verrucomicrobiae bacterium]